MDEKPDMKIEAALSEIGVVDSDGDMILAGAFDEAIDAGGDLQMLWMHERGNIVGHWADLRMDGSKLMADGVIYLSDGYDAAVRAAALIKRGLMRGVSIGFRPTEWKNVRSAERPWGWDIEKLDLIEASVVDKGANPGAEITEVKRKLDSVDGEEKSALEIPVLRKFYRGDIRIVTMPDTDAEKDDGSRRLGALASLKKTEAFLTLAAFGR